MDPAGVDESLRPGEGAREYVERVARAKAAAVASRHRGSVVLAADTTVEVGGEVLAKPADDADAMRMLRLLSGREHRVLTAVVVSAAGRTACDTVVAAVTFGALSPGEIQGYVASGEPAGKAGAYALQGLGGVLVERVEGDPSAVIGLPLRRTALMLADAGVPVGPARRG